MSGNTFGCLFRVTTFGESHGPALGVVVDGCPPGVPLAEGDLLPELRRRRPGQSRLVSARAEPDEPEIVSGVFEGVTTGAPICVLFRSRAARPEDYDAIRHVYRPGHADFTVEAKYGIRDHRGGGRSSARETVARVAAGAIARKILRREGIEIVGYTTQVGGVSAGEIDRRRVQVGDVDANAVRCPDPKAASAMEQLILQAQKDSDSIGGIAEFVVRGCPAGLGEPVFDKLKADLGKALLSLPAVTGFEYGAGFAAASVRGSEHNDPFVVRDGRVAAPTNRHGGILGGISSGEMIILRVPVKPTSSIPREQKTVTTEGTETVIRVTGRHDPCLVPRLVPIGEAMIALVLVDHLMRWRAQLSLSSPAPKNLSG